MNARIVLAALLVLLAGCRKRSRTTVTAEDASIAPLSAAPLASSAVDAAAPDASIPMPASKRVKPRLEIKYENEQPPRLMNGVVANDLPAITLDGRHVVVVGENESPKSCPFMHLLVLEVPAKVGRGRVVRDQGLVDDCDYDKDPGTMAPTETFRKNTAHLNAGNSILAAHDLRTFDGGALTLVTKDADGVITRVAGRTASGPLFDIDLSSIRTLEDKRPDGYVLEGTLNEATFDVDTQARVLVVRASYMSVNSWFPASQTTSVFRF